MTDFPETGDAGFAADVLDSPLPVLLDFYAPWCAPCRALLPTLADIAREYDGRLRIVKLNVDDNPETAGRFAVRSIPALMLFSGGKHRATLTGALTRSYLAEAVDDVLEAA